MAWMCALLARCVQLVSGGCERASCPLGAAVREVDVVADAHAASLSRRAEVKG
jgi:hypothetical protein